MEFLMEPTPVACGFGSAGDGKPFFRITARGKPTVSGVHGNNVEAVCHRPA